MKKGMSMVEILVVIGLTSMLLIGAMSMLSSAIRVQSETLARQSMIDQASYVLDIMTKELRMARKDYENDCGVVMPPDPTSEPTSSIYMVVTDPVTKNSAIRFYSQLNATCMEFMYYAPSSTVLFGSFQTSTVSGSGIMGKALFDPYTTEYVDKYLRLFSDDIKVDKFFLNVSGQDQNRQPMVTISMILKHKIKTSLPPVTIQTAVSSRNLNWTSK